MNEKDGNGRTVKSDETLISILELLLTQGRSGVTELSAELGLSPSTVHSHLNTLKKYEFVISDASKYELSLRFLEYGNKIRDQKTMYPAAQAPIDRLAEETQEQVWGAVVEENNVAFCMSALGQRAVSQPVDIGDRLLMHETAIGKSILAELPMDEVEKIIEQSGMPRKTENTITNPDVLFEDLDEIRQQGYALNLQERVDGINSIGTAIHDPTGKPIGGISILGAANRLTEEACHEEFSQPLIGTANEIDLSIEFD